MKLAIVGSRTFDDFNLLNETVCSCFMSEFMPYHIEAIISGGAKGKAAGFIRNKQIVDACDMVLAFWDGKSKGTEHTIKLARLAKKPTFIVYF